MKINIFFTGTAILAIALCASCIPSHNNESTTITKPDKPHKGVGTHVDDAHGYQILTKQHTYKPQGCGMYTYVLMKRDISYSNINEKRWDTTRELIKYIISKDYMNSPIFCNARRNLFLIPLTMDKYDKNLDPLLQFDYDHSKEIINEITSLLDKFSIPEISDAKSRLQAYDGPFLVSLTKPLASAKPSNTAIFYVDLTNYPSEGIELAVDTYKHDLDLDKTGVIRFESMKMKLLKYYSSFAVMDMTPVIIIAERIFNFDAQASP